ncbi:MAG: hypothetical protein EOO54_15325 [Haliea sp.]|nr:MAG: hypothetical protein EOO54_15325 [Haliea sp.]
MPKRNLPPYTVTLVNAEELGADQRAAAELRFRMALEFALGGPDMVLPTLKAWQLAVSLNDDLPLQSPQEAEREVIALWESAEADALIAALRPLERDMGDARFEISPRPQADGSWP